MRHRKVKGKKGRYPTHYVELCPNCKDGVMVKKINVTSLVDYKICQNCKYVISPGGKFQIEFTKGSEIK